MLSPIDPRLKVTDCCPLVFDNKHILQGMNTPFSQFAAQPVNAYKLQTCLPKCNDLQSGHHSFPVYHCQAFFMYHTSSQEPEIKW